MMVPEPMRPGWDQALAMSASRIPYERLATIDQRIELAAAKPVIIPDTVVIDHGKVFLSEVFLRAADTLGISVQPAHQQTGTAKPQAAYCTSSGRFVRSSCPGWSGVLRPAAGLGPVGRVVEVCVVKGSRRQVVQLCRKAASLAATSARNMGCRSIDGEYLLAGTSRPSASAMART